MNTQITYRQIGNEFSAAVIDLILPIQQEEFKVNVDLAAQPDLQAIEQYYQQSGGNFWGAFQGEQLVGTIALIAYQAGGGAIRKMFVRKEFRGKEWGIGQALLETLMTYAAQQRIRHLYLGTVSVLQAAMRFYEKNGFEQIPAETLPPAFPRMPADNIFYHRAL
ncbi:GNAT family N-acetyltransferase [Chitinophaga solisilvae]|uniref:GNAT family N-acetyltransferase n=1 Tax=Chitinophaga solisilvae TaxID=1233460 RepID=A0A433WHV5_9BACT|nr:GNAT family N-acetyltransferase [Chitinophaga solisilvae]NSL86412.1 GNAT family N-acetyltransferase [Chitinophaga solisilvae]